MIKQIKLFDSISNSRDLEEANLAQEAWERNGRPAISSLAASVADPSLRTRWVRERQALIETAEAELNTLIGEGYQIIAQYSIESVGVQLILYKPDTAPQPDEWPACNQCGGWHDPAQICGGALLLSEKSAAGLARFMRMRTGR